MKILIIGLIPLLLFGCLKYSYQQKMNYTAFGRQIAETDTLSFITKNGDQYSLQVVSVSAHEIQGQGRMKNQSHSWQDFSGTVDLDSIDILLYQKTAAAPLFVIAAGAIIVGEIYHSSLSGPDEPALEISYPMGSSCPYIYSKTDTGYCLEAEAFGTALGRALEIETSSCLPALSFNEPDLQIRISNERLETQYINSVSLAVVTHPADAVVVLDNAQISLAGITLPKTVAGHRPFRKECNRPD